MPKGFIAAVMLCLALLAASSAYAGGKTVQPGNAAVDGFLPSSSCTCHRPLVDAWSQSMHAQAIRDPVFLAKVGEAQAEAGDEVADFCKRCHSPIGNMTGDPNGTASAAAGEGVTCMFCHQVTGLDGEPANTNQLVDANLTRRAQLKDPAAPHPAVYSALHTTAEFCGACHNVDHPVNGTHLETSYSEWAAGPYAAEGIVCQDCHMSSAPGVIGPANGTACVGGAERDNIFTMSFVGANVGQGPADASTALLKSAATVELTAPEIVAGGSVASMTITVFNKGAGHYLPTGLTEVREMWLTVYTEGTDGSETPIGERRFGTVLKDAEGNYPAEMWEAAGVQSDDRIPPRGSVTSSFSFEMPKDAEQTKIVAALRYRSIPDELAAKSGVENPTTEMAASSQVVFASQALKDAAARPDASGDDSGDNGVSWPLVVGGAALLLLIGLGGYALARSRRG